MTYTEWLDKYLKKKFPTTWEQVNVAGDKYWRLYQAYLQSNQPSKENK